MNRQKLNGSFYTPGKVADFIVDFLSDKFLTNSEILVLEPSAGDGVFVKAVLSHSSLSPLVKKIVAVEKNKHELNKIKVPGKNHLIEAVHGDFLDFQKPSRRKFNLVVGNPPYIKKNHLKENQLKICKEIHSRAELSGHEPRNIWTAFLARCVSFMQDDGVLAFILPAEILQVKFAEELRQMLYKNFVRVEYLNFHELIFDAEGQNTVIVIGYKKSQNPGVYYTTINKVEDLAGRNFVLSKNDIIQTVSTKEIHHDVSAGDLSFLNGLKQRLKSISHYATSKPGIVTAANNFFIVDKRKRREYALSKYTKPIIQRGAFVNGKVEFKSTDWKNLSENDFPCYFLDLKKTKVNKDNKLKAYLRLGKKMEIDTRYKCAHRKKWYVVPNVTKPAEALFFKRSHHYPKLLKNVANAYVTDSAYMVNAKSNFSTDSIVYSFYNSLTLIFAELEGRYYGGGVLELTPSEFKNLPIPYLEIDSKSFRQFSKDFANKVSINTVLQRNDLQILGPVLGLTVEDVLRLRRIHESLLLKRLKINKF